jgi:hypothetical protein
LKTTSLLSAIGIAVALSLNVHAQDHGHLNVGAESQQIGAKLIFANGADFATNSAYVKTLTFTNAAVYAGYFQGNTTLTALPATGDRGGPDPVAPALGSRIAAQLVSVEGPAGGEFAFWDTGATAPTIKLKSGETGASTWILSENDGSPGTDPYGHIHGRRLTLTKPGLYKVGLRAIDISTNGLNGGPIHTPSDILYTYFQAGVNLLTVELNVDHTTVRVALPLGNTWQIEGNHILSPVSNLAAPGDPFAWNPIGDTIVGADFIREVIDTEPVQGQRYYRIRSVP